MNDDKFVQWGMLLLCCTHLLFSDMLSITSDLDICPLSIIKRLFFPYSSATTYLRVLPHEEMAKVRATPFLIWQFQVLVNYDIKDFGMIQYFNKANYYIW